MPGEQPIVVSGGSVTIEFPDNCTLESYPTQSASQKMNRYRCDGGTLLKVLVNGREVAKLSSKDRVEIIYDDGSTATSQP